VGLGLLGFACWMFWLRWSATVRWFARDWKEAKKAARNAKKDDKG